MVDSLLWHRSGAVIFVPSTALPADGGVVRFFDAGTNNPRTVYTDSGLTTGVTTVTLDSNGVCEDIWLPTGAFKYTIETSGSVVFATHDNQSGAVDTSNFLTGTVSPARAVISKSAAYTTDVSTDLGKQINSNATGGDFTITLDSAVDYADGGDQLIKNIGETGVVTATAAGGQLIDGEPSFDIGPKNSAVIRSDGSAFYVAEAYNATNNVVTTTYAASVPLDLIYPSGALYQITCTGDLTLANPTSARVGTYFQIAIVQDATGGRDVTFGSDFVTEPWVDVSASSTTVLGCFVRAANTIEAWPLTGRDRRWDYVAYNEQTQNTNGGTVTSGSWGTSTLNSADTDIYSLGDPSSNEVTLPPGKWEIEWYHPFNSCNVSQSRLYDTSGAAVLEYGTVVSGSSGVETTAVSIGHTVQTFSTATSVRIEHRVTSTRSNDAQGNAANFATERYLMFRATKLASI